MKLATADEETGLAEHGGRYELVGELAVGGMGVIHRAFDRLARREVAYKRLLAPSRDRRAALTPLFQREYGALSRLQHPNIVEVFDYGVDAAGPYYTMELLSGDDLTELAPMPYQEACRILRDVASALALLHARRLLHRDVSPRNIRLTREGLAKLLDFGGLMPFGVPEEVVGTTAFMAPECVRGGALDQRVDLYSLGAVAYWLLTGRPPRPGITLEELAGPLAPPALASTHVAEIPDELDVLVLSLLQAEPLARPSSAAYVIERLTSIAGLAPEREERRVAHSYLKQPVLVGREPLLAILERGLVSARAGRGSAVLIEGAPGLGRTALLDQLALSAELAGALVLRAEGVAASAPFSLANRLLEQIDGAAVRAMPTLDTLDTLAPSGPESRLVAELSRRRAQALELAERALVQASEQRPLVLIVDDLQLADAESLSLLAALSKRLGAQRLLLVGSASTAQVARDVHAYAKLRACATVCTLEPLREVDFVALLEGTFGGVPNTQRLAGFLYAHALGNPRHCMDLLRALLRRDVIRYAVGTFMLPYEVAAGLALPDLPTRALFDELGASARAVLAPLALHDGELSVQQLARIAEREVHEALHAVYELTARELVRRVASGGYVVSHRPLALLFARALASDHVRALHVRIARAVSAESGASLDDRLAAAQHFLEAGEDRDAEQLLAPIAGGLARLASSGSRAIAVFEKMLASYERAGRSERACLRWLVPIVSLAFFGDIGAQRRHLARTLTTLSTLCGLGLATRLRPVLGARVALRVGFFYAACRRAFTPRAERAGSLRELLTQLVAIVMSGVGAASSSYDSALAHRLLAWLEPLAGLPRDSGAALVRACCIATAELGAGRFVAASARYAAILETLAARPDALRGLDETAQRALYLACLNGRAQAEVANSSTLALELADQLSREGSAVFAPHPECTRMAYYAQRGDIAEAELHRARAEQLALQGGTSWAFVTVLAGRWAYAAMQTYDVIRLVQAMAELDRLAFIAPNTLTVKALCEAWLEYLRGRPERAIALYESVIESEVAKQLPSFRLDRVLFATVLNAAGQYRRARELCLSVESQGELVANLREAQLAVAEAGRGDFAQANERLARALERAGRTGNPLELGNLERQCAWVALLARERAAFEEHLQRMGDHYRATGNPTLIQQCEVLFAEGVRRGLVTPASSERASAFDDLDGATVLEV